MKDLAGNSSNLDETYRRQKIEIIAKYNWKSMCSKLNLMTDFEEYFEEVGMSLARTFN